MGEPLDVLVFYVPMFHKDDVLLALFEVGAGRVGDYEECVFYSKGMGEFRPVRGANPTIGEVGKIELVEEYRVELTFPRSLRDKVVATLRKAHPYEEPAFHVLRNEAS